MKLVAITLHSVLCLINSIFCCVIRNLWLLIGEVGQEWHPLKKISPTLCISSKRWPYTTQAVAAHQIMDQLGRQSGIDHDENLNGLEVDLEYLKFAEFQKANPPSFRGAFDPDKAKQWVKAMEKVFSILDYIDHQKVAFATYMLDADAKFWWNSVKRLLEDSQTEIIWDVFKEAFY